MIITEQLNKLPLKPGKYLVINNLTAPYFIIPLHSRKIFLKAISLVKTRNRTGWIKKTLLGITPFFLLRKLFPVIDIRSKNNNNESHQLILPWNQDVCNKFTIFNFDKNGITLIKVGFNECRRMINNEKHSILQIPEFGKNIKPEIIEFSENDEFSLIETIFYAGKHPKCLPNSIIDFFEQIKKESESIKMINHPYVTNILKIINKALTKDGNSVLQNKIDAFLVKYGNTEIPIVLMHADCSKTNIITTKDGHVIIDWEESIINGIPIDIGYFDFRIHIDNGKSWGINNEIDFLVVLHYIYLQIKHNNVGLLRKISLEMSMISV